MCVICEEGNVANAESALLAYGMFFQLEYGNGITGDRYCVRIDPNSQISP